MVGPLGRCVRACLLALAACAALQASAAAPGTAGRARNAFEEQVDALAREGFEHPAPALASLQQLLPDHGGSTDEQRMLLAAMGGVEAQTGASAQALAHAEQLLQLATGGDGRRFVAASDLVRALVAENAGKLDMAATLAQTALPALQAGCPVAGPASPAVAAAAPTAASAPAADPARCDYRAAWRALKLLERHAFSQGVPVVAEAHVEAARALAEWAGDARRESTDLVSLAGLAQRRGDHGAALALLARARHLALQTGDAAQQARVAAGDGYVATLHGDLRGSLRSLEDASRLATSANAPRAQARVLNDLSDIYIRLGRPADALRAAERALPIVRLRNDVQLERILVTNIGIAKIGLGRLAEGKQDMARVLDLWRQSGEAGSQAQTLLEFGEALAAAGDAHGALDLYHQERALSSALMQANRAAALKELQTRNDAQARQRDIELLERDNALKTAALANRELLQRIGWVLAAVILLSIALVAMLYRRVRETHQKLAANHVQLRAQSERDPLTDLANRRHFQAVMATLCGSGGFDGALLLIDIDHFKRVNDTHGHGAGDQVLVEVAKRLNNAVRAEDLVVRWGGEEFLILAPRAAPEQADQMAARVLRSLGEKPFGIGAPLKPGPAFATAQLLRVTASIGYARFPLPPHGTEVPWEQAVNLADMALYTAKNQGRNQAVGISAASAATRDELLAIEADFDLARHEGRVTLLNTAGPEMREALRVA